MNKRKSSATKMEHGSNVVLKFNHETMVFVVVLAVLASLTYMGSRDRSRRDTLSNEDSLPLAVPRVVSTVTNDSTAAPSSSSDESSSSPASIAIDEPSPVSTGTKFEIGSADPSTNERNTATDLDQQFKRAKTTVKEAAIGTDLNVELKKAKTAIKEGLRGEYPDSINAEINSKGFGKLRRRIGGSDPMPVIMPIIPRDTFSFSYENDLGDTRLYTSGRTYQELARDAERDTNVRGNFGLINNVYVPKRRAFTVDLI